MTVITTAPLLRQTISELVALRDPEGILSIYVDAGAQRGNRHRPRAGEIALRRGLESLRADLDAEGRRERARLLEARLAESAGSLADLVDPTRPGRGRALVVPLSGGSPVEVRTTRPMGDRVVFAPTACATPLLGPLAESDTAGVASLGGEGVRVVEVRADGAEEVLRAPYGIPSDDWRPMVGPARATPGHPQESESQRDLFARRLEEHRTRRVREIAAAVWQEAARRGWERLAVTGSGERVRALQETRPPDGPPILVLGVQLSHEAAPEMLRGAVAGPLADARRRTGRELAEHLRDEALAAAGRAVVGLDDTLGTLFEGRVERLVLDAAARHEGALAPDGRMVVAGEIPPGVAPSELVPEPHLVERMIERALATGAALVVLEGPAAEPLAPFGGVAAALRW